MEDRATVNGRQGHGQWETGTRSMGERARVNATVNITLNAIVRATIRVGHTATQIGGELGLYPWQGGTEVPGACGTALAWPWP